MLTLHTSHRLESLADALAGVLRESPGPPLVPEIVVVQSLGMRRWLSFQLAARLGVAMNIRFPFPAEFADQMFAAHLGRSPSPVFLRDHLPWRIYGALPALLADDDFRELHHYTGDDPLRQWQLAAQIAATFDRYLAHRPELLTRWDAGEISDGESWQATLWRKIAGLHAHPPAMLAQLGRRSKANNTQRNSMRPPGRSCIFGLSSLAPAYLALLATVAELAEIHLFLLAPTREYWGDIRSEREQARFATWREKRGSRGAVHPFAQGHPLLASLGKVGREFHEAILDLTPAAEHEHFDSQPPASALGRLQHDILTLATRDAEPLDSADRSIQFHNCHSPLRELEVLHDQLLALFECDRTLEPRDVLVAMPDIETYAPFIEAVFGAPEGTAIRLPFSIADRAFRADNGIADAFLRLLDLTASHFTATAVLSLLDCPAIRAQFQFAESDLAHIRRWVSGTGIRWGRDAAHRASLDLPERGENTWQFGLDRLLLGFALPGDGESLFHGILPSPEIEGALATTLGRLAEFCGQLFSKITPLARARTAGEWSRDLHDVLTTFCSAADSFADEWRGVAADIAAISDIVATATHDITDAPPNIPFSVISDHLATLLADTGRGSGFLRGGVTFCSLRPMRAIPHRVVCILGLDDGAFPRHERPPGFDLTASQPRPGDRTRREDDRHLFLEALLSARDTLYVSWCGQSPHDNSALPPSVVVSELLEHLARAFSPPPAITAHRLQAFSPAYFSGGDLFSYSAENRCESPGARPTFRRPASHAGLSSAAFGTHPA
jgi:exodeoxyribonuclease V gamma subunit